MLYVAGRRRPCHQLKFLPRLNGSLEGKLAHCVLFLVTIMLSSKPFSYCIQMSLLNCLVIACGAYPSCWLGYQWNYESFLHSFVCSNKLILLLVSHSFGIMCSKPSQQVILDYDYTFTTPYCGSATVEIDKDLVLIPSFFSMDYICHLKCHFSFIWITCTIWFL